MSKYIDFILARLYVFILGMAIAIVGLISPNESLNRLKSAVKDMDK